MAGATGDVYVQIERLDQINDAVDFLNSNELLVGIPESNSARSGGGMTNVALAYLHSNGSPLMHIPARPFIEPAIEQDAVKSRIAGKLGDAIIAAIEDGNDAAIAQMHQAGIIGENAVKTYIGSGHLAENAPITISGGWMHNHKSGKIFYVKGKESSAPLIDTGALRSSITHVIRKGS